MTHRIGPKGQVVIPKAMRDQLGLHPGVEVDFELDDAGVRLVARPETVKLGGMFKGMGGNMAAELLADRAREPR